MAKKHDCEADSCQQLALMAYLLAWLAARGLRACDCRCRGCCATPPQHCGRIGCWVVSRATKARIIVFPRPGPRRLLAAVPAAAAEAEEAL